MTPAAVKARWARVKQSQVVPTFGSAEFFAYVKSSRTDAAGEMEITLHIPGPQKYNALPITDAPGLMLLFQVDTPPKD